jgi:hypothetical protein
MVDVEDWEPDPQILALVNAALDDLKTRTEFVEPDEGEDKYSPQWTKEVSPAEYPPDCARMRLDFELVDESELTNSQILDVMFEFLSVELADLLERGDTSQLTDPLLAVYDGSRKRGKQLKSVHIPSSVIYREHKPGKNTFEYTTYWLLTAEWA